jgi:hypothetical protein
LTRRGLSTHSSVDRARSQQARPQAIRSEGAGAQQKTRRGQGRGRLRRRTRSAALVASPEAHHCTIVIFIQLACFGCQRGKESIDGIRRLGSFVIASMAPGFARNGLPVGVAHRALGNPRPASGDARQRAADRALWKINGQVCSRLPRRKRGCRLRAVRGRSAGFPDRRANPLIAGKSFPDRLRKFCVRRFRELPQENPRNPWPVRHADRVDGRQNVEIPCIFPWNREFGRGDGFARDCSLRHPVSLSRELSG